MLETFNVTFVGNKYANTIVNLNPDYVYSCGRVIRSGRHRQNFIIGLINGKPSIILGLDPEYYTRFGSLQLSIKSNTKTPLWKESMYMQMGRSVPNSRPKSAMFCVSPQNLGLSNIYAVYKYH